jgi:hypothetical protein
MNQEFDEKWAKLGKEVLSGMKEWRLAHPRATLGEIEAAIDERLGRLRSQMIADAALASDAADWREVGEKEKARCQQCGAVVQARGEGERRLQTGRGQEVVLKRQYGVCPQCGAGFFPPG